MLDLWWLKQQGCCPAEPLLFRVRLPADYLCCCVCAYVTLIAGVWWAPLQAVRWTDVPASTAWRNHAVSALLPGSCPCFAALLQPKWLQHALVCGSMHAAHSCSCRTVAVGLWLMSRFCLWLWCMWGHYCTTHHLPVHGSSHKHPDGTCSCVSSEQPTAVWLAVVPVAGC